MSEDRVTMQDYLKDDPDVQPSQTSESGEDDPDVQPSQTSESDYPYPRDMNEHGTPQRCRYCGQVFDSGIRRNHLLNRHKAECDAREEFYDDE